MDDLLEKITLDDLRGNERELAEVLGLEAFKSLVRVYGGTSRLYVPKADTVALPVRDALIRREYDGGNVPSLAAKWNLTERWIEKLVEEEARELRRKPMDGQVSLADLAG